MALDLIRKQKRKV